jgi:hypothetical protein
MPPRVLALITDGNRYVYYAKKGSLRDTTRASHAGWAEIRWGSGVAIALALFVFGKVGSTATVATTRIGSWARGPSAWRTLRRWISAIDAGRLFPCVRASPSGWSARQRAERAAMTVAALVPATFAAEEDARVFAGAALAA